MKKFILIIAVVLTAACQRVDTKQEQKQLTTVRFNVRASGIVAQTRADSGPDDVNLFLFSTADKVNYSLYTGSGDITMTVVPGSYTLYVVGNVGEDLRNLKETALRDLFIDAGKLELNIPMTYRAEVDIPQQSTEYILPDIILKRTAVKIECNIMVETDGIELQSLSLCSVPPGIKPFAAIQPDGFYDMEPVRMSGQKFSGTFFMYEHLAGINDFITQQTEKNSDNAPENASYMHIRAVADSRMIDYFVFLGDNNTSDFNVRRNTNYTYIIRIKSPDQIDTRIYDYTVNVIEMGTSQTGYITTGEILSGSVLIDGRNDIYDLTKEIEFTGAIPEGISFGGGPATIGKFLLSDGYGIEYNPSTLVRDNTMLSYKIFVSDNYGFTWEFNREYRCMNLLEIEFIGLPEGKRCTATTGNGLVMSAGAATLKVLCGEEVTLNFSADDGIAYDGMYRDMTLNSAVSQDNPFIFRASLPKEVLYASILLQNVTIFTDPERVSIDSEKQVVRTEQGYMVEYNSKVLLYPIRKGEYFTDWLVDGTGTGIREDLSLTVKSDVYVSPCFKPATNLTEQGMANCYITPLTRASYIFDASVRGNGKGIGTLPYSFKDAIILWESGDREYSVIEDIYTDGRFVSFCTGENTGNAVIAVRDDKGEIAWSWHIWSHPDAGRSVTLPDGGNTFLDRNLGALSYDGPQSYGLYYQWGRKDPFVGPANESENSTVTHHGYRWEFLNTHETVRTVIAVPMSYCMPVERSPYDWSFTPDGTLWGQINNGQLDPSGETAKSAYDPCPVGWKVTYHGGISNPIFYNKQIEEHQIRFTTGEVEYVFPFGGYMESYPARLTRLGERAAIWTSSPNFVEHKSKYIYHDRGGIMSYWTESRSAAMPVRCIKDN